MVVLYDFIKRHSGSVAWVFALILGILLSQAPFPIKSYLAGVFVDTIYRPFNHISRTYHLLKDRRTENLLLKEELISTRLKLEAFKEAERENIRLRDALDFSERIKYYTVLAEVIGRGTPRMPSSIIVGVGANRGVIVGLPVIDKSGIVGKVVSVYDNSSIVQLINDPNLKISALDGRSRVQGIVSAVPGGKLLLENVPINADIRSGDPIISSGLGGVFPKGLAVGTISRVIVPQSGLFCKVEIEPAAKLTTLEEVFILFSGIVSELPDTLPTVWVGDDPDSEDTSQGVTND